MRVHGLYLLIGLLILAVNPSSRANEDGFPLHQSVKNDDLAVVQSLLSQGMHIECNGYA